MASKWFLIIGKVLWAFLFGTIFFLCLSEVGYAVANFTVVLILRSFFPDWIVCIVCIVWIGYVVVSPKIVSEKCLNEVIKKNKFFGYS